MSIHEVLINFILKEWPFYKGKKKVIKLKRRKSKNYVSDSLTLNEYS